MRIVDVVFVLVSAVCAFAQSGGFAGVAAIKDGIGGFTIETHIEPQTQAMVNSIAGGVNVGSDWFHRYLTDAEHKKFFGYDFLIESGDQPGNLRVTFRPLSLTAASLGLKDAKKWALLPLSRYPVSQTVNSGGTIALDLMTNPKTGQKIVDYLVMRGDPEHTRQVADMQRKLLTLKQQRAALLTTYTPNHYKVRSVDQQIALLEAELAKPENRSGSGRFGVNAAEIQDRIFKLKLQLAELQPTVSAKSPQVAALSAQMAVLVAERRKLLRDLAGTVRANFGPAHDFNVEDTELQIAGPSLIVNGKQIDEVSGSGGVTGPDSWIYLAGHGRFTFSLAPQDQLGYRKAGEVRGSAMTFTVAGNTYVLNCDARIAPGPDAYNLYVLHDPAYRPKGADSNARFLQGAGR